MYTVKEVRELTGISARTLHHYDAIGLLRPTQLTEAGYRLYDDDAVEQLYMILLYRELGFSLAQIQKILGAPDFDRNRILDHQIDLMEKKITHIKNRITLARGIRVTGTRYLDMKDFKPEQIDDYASQAKTLYGKTDAYREYSAKSAGRTAAQERELGSQVMDFFVELGSLKHLDPGSEEVQDWVKRLQAFFTANYYHCTPQILLSLGATYAGGGSMTENIDNAGGKGTGEFACRAIEIYCGA